MPALIMLCSSWILHLLSSCHNKLVDCATVWLNIQGILTTLSQSNGGYKYDYATIPFLAEIFKVSFFLLSISAFSVYCSQFLSILVLNSRVSHVEFKLYNFIEAPQWFWLHQYFTDICCHLFVLQLLVSSFYLWKDSRSSSPPRMTKEWKSMRLFPIPSIIYLVHNNVQFATLTYVDPSTYQIMGNLKIVTTGILFRCCSPSPRKWDLSMLICNWRNSLVLIDLLKWCILMVNCSWCS